MSVLRARTSCPRCFTEEEIWYYKGLVEPISKIECQKCSYIYESSDFVVSILELRQNVTMSTTSAIGTVV
jgi:Zn ribbon nucleic-acid-binding protein